MLLCVDVNYEALFQKMTNNKGAGTQDFREAVRTALETNKEIVGTHGVYNMSPTDHTGVDQRASVLVQVKNGDWALVRH